MSNMMSLEWIADKACWRFINRNNPAREVFFSPAEIGFIEHSLERNAWQSGIAEQVEYDEDNLDFSTITREEFIDMCDDELQNRWEICSDIGDPDYGGIVFDVAQENGIWRD